MCSIKSDQLFGNLVAISPVGVDQWLCYCICGNECVYSSKALLAGKHQDCGDCWEPYCPEQIDRNVFIYQGREYSSKELVKLTGISWQLLRYRMIDCGMTLTQAIAFKPPVQQSVSYQGQQYSFNGLAIKLGISRNTAYKRRAKGWPLDQIYDLPAGSLQLV